MPSRIDPLPTRTTSTHVTGVLPVAQDAEH
jgi:hypothetical protein